MKRMFDQHFDSRLLGGFGAVSVGIAVFNLNGAWRALALGLMVACVLPLLQQFAGTQTRGPIPILLSNNSHRKNVRTQEHSRTHR